MRRFGLLRFLLCFGLFFIAQPIFACIDYIPMETSDITKADAIFVGEITKYQPIENLATRASTDRDEPRYARAILTYRVDEVLRGDLPPTVDVIWPNWTFGIPENSPFSGSQITALALAPSREGEMAYFLLQPACSAPFQFVASAQNRRIVERLLEDPDAALDQGDLSSLLQRPAKENLDKKQSRSQTSSWLPTKSDWIYAVTALIGLVVIGALFAGFSPGRAGALKD